MFAIQSLPQQKKQSLIQQPSGQELLSIFLAENLTTHFQPIVDMNQQSIFAFEALTRGPENSKLFSPLNLFYAAEKHDCLRELDHLARKMALQNFSSLDHLHQYQAKLFLNVSAQSLQTHEPFSDEVLFQLDRFGLTQQQVVIEITESHPIEDTSNFLQTMDYFRQLGFQIALDDLGAGYNGLKLWSEVKPDYVKIDKHFISGIDTHADKYRFMETIYKLASTSGCKVIAEGVETQGELHVLEKIGVDYVQGYLLKKPSPMPSLNLEFDWPHASIPLYAQKETIGSICQKFPSHDVHSSVKTISEYLLAHPELECLPLLENHRPEGLVWRNQLMNLLASPFGRDLHLKKPIHKFMDTAPLIYDANTPLLRVSRDITTRGDLTHSAFIITHEQRYVGMGTFLQLLETITDLKIQGAKYANPLSGLPGNVPIQTTLEAYLKLNSLFYVLYIDVDHFKPFNDFYSFEQGDQVITTLSEVLQQSMLGHKGFVGHIGGDDFVIITQAPFEPICASILANFRQKITSFYLESDRQQGGIQAHDREGRIQFYPMMSLSIGVLKVHPKHIEHRQQISSLATQAKKGAKALGGNQYFVLESSGPTA